MSKSSVVCQLEHVREDDYVEYYIFPSDIQCENHVDLQQYLEGMRVKCMAIVERYVNELDYIWHKDFFQLQIRTVSSEELILDDGVTTQGQGNSLYQEKLSHSLVEAKFSFLQSQNATSTDLPPHLHGVTHFGDNIADEWFIVYLLYKLTLELPDCIARVVDVDGEFMLIEAAEVLPKWANPDTCEQRVYIAGGHLQLVQNSPTNTSKLLPIAEALRKIRLNPTLYRVSNDIEDCINGRLKEFQQSSIGNTLFHRQIVRLPLSIAALLKHRPSLIASAVRAYCERDSIDLKACRSMRFFPVEQRTRINVRFTRCLYAMLMHSNYAPDRKIGWDLNDAPNTEEYKENILGIKITCGFEILVAQAKQLESEGNEPAWKAYVKSLTSKGYFQGNLEGSQRYQMLMKEARNFFVESQSCFRTGPLVGREIVDLMKAIEIDEAKFYDNENNLQPSDSDDWLNVSAEQLDAMLTERFGIKKLYKSNGDINAEEFTKNLTEFIEKSSEFDGIDGNDPCSDDGVDGDISDEPSCSIKSTNRKRSGVKKNFSMRKACNENPIIKNAQSPNTSHSDNLSTQVKNLLDFVIPEDNWESNSDMSDYEDEDDLERNIEAMSSSERNINSDIKNYMAKMDEELSRTTIGQTFRNTKKPNKIISNGSPDGDDDFDDIESFEPININVNTLKNMMDSYKSQVGRSGPVTNLLSAMGVGMSNAIDSDDDLTESAV